MFGAINAMTAEMMAIAAKIGIEPRRLFEIITASQAGTVSNLFKELGKRVGSITILLMKKNQESEKSSGHCI
jgi:3-hydroxyisobutyrate dehydrogenase-like beta-hydroxyacid dehydrogenase